MKRGPTAISASATEGWSVPPALREGPNPPFEALYVYWTLPESGVSAVQINGLEKGGLVGHCGMVVRYQVS